MAVDPRFYGHKASLTGREIAKLLNADAGNLEDIRIASIASFGEASPTDLSFVESAETLALHADQVRGLCLTTPKLAARTELAGAALVVASPRTAFLAVAETLVSLAPDERAKAPNIHETARIADGVTIGPNAAIGDHTVIQAGAVIGPGVQIGSHCQIGSHVSVNYALIGNGVTLQAGARIGEAGFGLLHKPTGAIDIPHYGRVLIQDNVSIGANTCVDRGMLGDTVIGEGTKIDNMSHVGHNTKIGRHVIMAAYAGISGSVTIGDGVHMGGRVGIMDHVEICAGARLAIGALVMKDVPAGQSWAGNPAQPLKAWQREMIWLKNNAKKKRET